MRTKLLVATYLLAALCGCGKKKDGDEPPQPLGPADFTVSALELKNEFKADSKAAEAKYNGKVVEVSGTVLSMTRHDDKVRGLIMLESDDEWKIMPSCICIVPDKNMAGQIGRGQTVKFKGRYFQNLMAPTLTDCELVEKGPDTAIHLTAEQLAKEYTADPKACEKRCEKKTLVVTGEIAAMKTDENKVKFAELKGDGKTVVEIRFVALFAEWPAEFVDGAKVKLAAEMLTLGNAPGKCVIVMDVPLDP